ncbi:hypothetical protein N9988_00520 [bacterium]|nr:hypothetical protein [bacterium]
MSAYDNPRMINDPRAAASANVGNMIGSALADIGKSYAGMRATQKAKVERTQELNQKILNATTNRNNSMVLEMEESLRESNIPQNMWDAAIKNQRLLFDGFGVQGDKDFVMGATQAQYLLDTDKNLSSEDRTKYNEIKNKATSNIQKVLGKTGKYGAEATEIAAYIKSGSSDLSLTWRGYQPGDQLASQLTGMGLARQTPPGVETTYELINGADVYTHRVSKDNDLINSGVDMTTSDLDDVTIKEDGDYYVITQTLGFEGNTDMLVNVQPGNNSDVFDEIGKVSTVLNDEGNLESDLKIELTPTIERIPNSSRIQSSTLTYMPIEKIQELTSRQINIRAAKLVNGQSNQQLASYFENRFNINVLDIKPDYFNGMSNEDKIDYLAKIEMEGLVNDFTDDFKKGKLTESQINEILVKKAEGNQYLSNVPDKGSKEFEVWKNADHYYLETKGAEVNDSSKPVTPPSETEWTKNDLTWFNDPNFGNDAIEFYTPGSGSSNTEDLILESGLELANVIQGNPNAREVTRIIQTSKDKWQAQKAVFSGENVGYKNIGKPASKLSLKRYLGIK